MNKTKRNKNFIKIGAASILAVAGLALNVPTLKQHDYTAYAVQDEYESSITISNSSFSTNTSSSYPYSPNSYTELRQDSNLKAGVINLSDSVWQEKATSDYDLTITNPTPYGSDNYVLMINSQGVSNYMGYQSSTISLPASGHYKISVAVWSSGPIASLYLYNTSSEEVISSMENIDTAGKGWILHTFYVSTSTEEDLIVALQMYLGTNDAEGGNGVVFFDELSAKQITELSMNTIVGDSPNGANYRYADLVDNLVKTYNFNNTSDQIFKIDEDISIDSTKTQYGYKDVSDSTAGTDNSYNSTVAFYVENKYESYSSFKSSIITLEPNKIFRFTLMSKVINYSQGQVTISICSDDEDIETQSLTITENTSASATNGYVDYSFYIKSDPLENKDIYFKIEVGSSSELAMLDAYFMNLSEYLVSYSTFSSLSTSSTVASLDLTSNYSTTSSSETYGYFTNPAFNLMEAQSSIHSTYPYLPTSWTHSGDEENTLFGVVHSSYFDTLHETYPSIVNPGLIADYSLGTDSVNNVLLMHNKQLTYQSFTSSSITLNSGSLYELSIYVQTTNATNGARVEIVDDSENILGFIDGIQSSTWQKVSIYIKTYNNSVTAKLRLILGTDSATTSGSAYFDNAKYTLISDTTIDNISTNEFIKTFDLSDIYATSTDNANFNSPMYMEYESVKGSENVGHGIVNINNANNTNTVGYIPYLEGENKFLVITANSDVYFTYTTIQRLSFTAENYYILTFKVYTANMSSEYENYGASIELVDLSNSITAVKSTETNGWTEFKFYIYLTETSSSKIAFSLGSSDAPTTGTVVFARPVLEQLDSSSDDYDEKLADFKTMMTQYEETEDKTALTYSVVTTASEENSEEEETTEEEDDGFKFNWIYFSSIVLVLAVIIAIVGSILKRVEFKLPKFRNIANKENRKLVARQLYAYDANVVRNKELKELKDKSEKMHTERTALENEYKENLTKIRDLKMSRKADNLRLAKATTKINKSLTKKINRLGKKIGALNKEIEIVSSDEYIQMIEQDFYKKNKKQKSNKKLEENQDDDQDE